MNTKDAISAPPPLAPLKKDEYDVLLPVSEDALFHMKFTQVIGRPVFYEFMPLITGKMAYSQEFCQGRDKLRSGDELLAVDGIATQTLNFQQVMSLLKRVAGDKPQRDLTRLRFGRTMTPKQILTVVHTMVAESGKPCDTLEQKLAILAPHLRKAKPVVNTMEKKDWTGLDISAVPPNSLVTTLDPQLASEELTVPMDLLTLRSTNDDDDSSTCSSSVQPAHEIPHDGNDCYYGDENSESLEHCFSTITPQTTPTVYSELEEMLDFMRAVIQQAILRSFPKTADFSYLVDRVDQICTLNNGCPSRARLQEISISIPPPKFKLGDTLIHYLDWVQHDLLLVHQSRNYSSTGSCLALPKQRERGEQQRKNKRQRCNLVEAESVEYFDNDTDLKHHEFFGWLMRTVTKRYSNGIQATIHAPAAATSRENGELTFKFHYSLD